MEKGIKMNVLKNQKGFGFLETVLTVTLLSVALLGGMTVMQNAVAKSVTGDMNTVATEAASEKLELIMADLNFSGYDEIVTENYPSEDLQDLYSLTRQVIVTEVGQDLQTAQAGSGLKRVDVYVSWGDNASQRVKVSTVMADYQ